MTVQEFANRWQMNIVRVYSYQDKQLQGCIYNAVYAEEVEFHNLMQFLLGFEDILNKVDYPMSEVKLRQFKKTKHTVFAHVPAKSQAKTIATFQVKLLFRQHASWQGTVVWTEGKREESFRSALELLHLIDNALTLSVGEETDSEAK